MTAGVGFLHPARAGGDQVRTLHGRAPPDPSRRLARCVQRTAMDLARRAPSIASPIHPRKESPMQSQHQPVDRATAIETLNRLMRGELSAVETYRHAMSSLGPETPDELVACLRSHDLRAARLAEHVALAGGTPVSGSGLWGAFARVVEGGAALLGARTLFTALEEGEGQGLADYRAALDRVDVSGLAILRGELLPEQIRTHGLMSSLCRRFG